MTVLFHLDAILKLPSGQFIGATCCLLRAPERTRTFIFLDLKINDFQVLNRDLRASFTLILDHIHPQHEYSNVIRSMQIQPCFGSLWAPFVLAN